MIAKQDYKDSFINLLLNRINKKGKYNTAKTILSKSSVNISKINDNYSFNKLFEDIILNYVLRFKPNKKNHNYKSMYLYKCISNGIKTILTNITKNKKRVSFDFYFKKEIEKLLDSIGNLTITKNNNYEYIKFNKKFENYQELEILPFKKNIIKNYYKHSSKFNKKFYKTINNYK